MTLFRRAIFTTAFLFAPVALFAIDPLESWLRHTIDDSSRGADGVKLGDLNGDGLMDLTVGWEEGGITRIYLHPGPKNAKQQWPTVTIGETPSAEDATFVDLNGDDRLDVVSSCEGSEQALYVHIAPSSGSLLDGNQWTQFPLPGSVGMTRWMFANPATLEFQEKTINAIVAGSKNPNGTIGYWEIPADPSSRKDSWNWNPLSAAGWIMSIILKDMDNDGDSDIVYTDRRGGNRGAYWLENPGAESMGWQKRLIGGWNEELLFSNFYDLDQDGLEDFVATAKSDRLLVWKRSDTSARSWQRTEIRYPPNTGHAKAVAIADFDLDGFPDIVANCEGAIPPKQGVFWLRQSPGKPIDEWEARGISGSEGIKFDRIVLLDIDLDGDLDILTCEEHHEIDGKPKGLGVIWYENPFGARS